MVAEISAHMAQAGYDVYVICHDNAVQDAVTYVTDAGDIPGHDTIIYCPTFFLFIPAQIATFKTLRPRMAAVVVWLQCILQQYTYDICALPDQVYVVAPSRFALTDLPHRQFADISIIPNGLNPGVFSDVTRCAPQERFGVWTFHACWERGGNVAYRAFCRYPSAKSFVVADLTSNCDQTLLADRRVAVKPRMSKRQLARQMAAADYFVYPLVLPNAHVHHDTYGCSVLEAMACGAIVVSWNVACLGELYGDHAILLEPPDYDGIGSASSSFASCTAMLSDACVDRIVEAITRCDEDPVAKEARREAAREWALRQTWERSGCMFERAMTKQSASQMATSLQDLVFDAGVNKSDKGSTSSLYHALFSQWRDRALRVFEVGIGLLPSDMGTQGRPGASLYGWCEYFPYATVVGANRELDVMSSDSRITIVHCDQTNPVCISDMWKKFAFHFDIIIEDGLPKFDAKVCFFENSIHKLAMGGYYIIEDIAGNDVPTMESRVDTWKTRYPSLTFRLFRLPSVRNDRDNNLLVAHKPIPGRIVSQDQMPPIVSAATRRARRRGL